MTTYFPVTKPIGNDADVIMIALNSRSEQLRKRMNSQGFVEKTTLIALKFLGLSSGVLAASSIPVTLILFTAKPLTIGAIALCTAITCLALSMALDARSPGELIIRDQWKAVFDALRKGNGKQIIDTCQELAKQKEKRAASFNQCLGNLSPDDTTPFFHKTCLVGYLQIAMEHLRNGKEDMAKSNAHMALSHFSASGFSTEIENFLQAITYSPKSILSLIEKYQAGENLHALDYFVTIKIQGELKNT